MTLGGAVVSVVSLVAVEGVLSVVAICMVVLLPTTTIDAGKIWMVGEVVDVDQQPAVDVAGQHPMGHLTDADSV